ncbi:MAG: hypothetical protein K0S61_1731 [Anaerocolumna sp.]|jgi:hypothetical protein|nr:hypothetical protein [Anaerocolumna sp.]
MFKNNKNTENITKKEGFHPLKAIGMMGACCILPIILVAVLPLLNFGTRGTVFLSSISSLICPIMMVLMMAVMFFGGRKKDCCEKDLQDDNK